MEFLRSRYQTVRPPPEGPLAHPAEPPKPAVPYLRRRILPLPESLIAVSAYSVEAGERLDQIAARTLGSPLAYWRIADINGAMNPFALAARPGAVLAVPAAISEIETSAPDYDADGGEPAGRP
jgi:nucleoid-associated protein YgaU